MELRSSGQWQHRERDPDSWLRVRPTLEQGGKTKVPGFLSYLITSQADRADEASSDALAFFSRVSAGNPELLFLFGQAVIFLQGIMFNNRGGELMEESTLKIPNRLYINGALTAVSLLAVFFTIRELPQWYAWLAIIAFILVFGHTTWSWFSFTMLQSRDESLKDSR
jgi:hypothetical protein